MKLTEASIRRLELPPTVSERTFFCDLVAGFGVRLRGTEKRYVYQYKVGAKNRRIVLGAVTSLHLGRARDMARDLAAKVRLGEDPFAQREAAKQAAGETFGALLPRFLAAKRDKLSPKWHGQTEALLLEAAKPLHGHVVRNISRAQIADLLERVAETRGPGQANRFRAVLSSYYTWAIASGRADSNPVSGTAKPGVETKRDRVLNDAELAAIWRHAGDGPFGAIARLLILLGARRSELGDLRWSELNLVERTIVIPRERMKGGEQHVIPLPPAAVRILEALPKWNDRDCVFGSSSEDRGYSGWSKSKVALDRRLHEAGESLEPWTFHDFRRSFSTTMHERLHVAPHIVESLLAHKVGGVASHYNWSTYTEARRDALEKYAAHIERIVAENSKIEVAAE
jgi:integrase